MTNYPLRESLIAFLTGRDTRALAETLHAQYLRYPAANRRCLMNLLGSHDTVRIVNALAGADGWVMGNRLTLTGSPPCIK